MSVEELFDLTRVDVLTATNDHVLDAPGDLAVTMVVHDGQVAGVQPVFTVYGTGGFVRHLVVPPHDVVATGAEFTLLAGGKGFAGFDVYDLDLHIRQRTADGGDAQFDGVIGTGLGDNGGGFGLAVGDGYFRGVHLGIYFFHDFDGAVGAGHDAGAQGGQVEGAEFRVLKFSDEHGRDAVDSGAFLFFYSLENFQRVEYFHRYHGGAVGDAGHDGKDAAEAVEEGNRDAEPVFFAELHAFADVEAVVDDVAVGQHDPFGEAGGAGGVLHIDGFVTVEGRFDGGQFGVRHPLPQFDDAVEVEHPGGGFFRADEDDVLEERQFGGG